MSQNENNNNEDKVVIDLFSIINNTETEPSPYMQARVLSKLQEDRVQLLKLRLWQTLAVIFFVTSISLTMYQMNFSKPKESLRYVGQSYVIHFEIKQAELLEATQAEVVLPDGVHFVSSKGVLDNEKKLKLAVDIKKIGLSKLPFVFSADVKGEKEIRIRFLGQNNQLIHEHVLKYKFVEKADSKGMVL